MRINGFTQIKSFYSWTFENQDKGVKPHHISLYLFLLNQNNRNNWIEWFKCPFDLAMAGSCISSKKTYYNCLNELQEWKLIQYRKGTNNWKAPLIKLEVLKDTSTVPQSEPQLEQLVEQATEPLSTLLPTHIYKLITDNHKLITDNLQSWLSDFKPNDKIDFDSILKLINDSTGKNLRVVSNTVKPKYFARLKEGYTVEDIKTAIVNAANHSYHKENNYQYLTLEFFSRSTTIDKYATSNNAQQTDNGLKRNSNGELYNPKTHLPDGRLKAAL